MTDTPSDIALFDFEGTRIRTVVRDGQPWFVASDVARVLGYSDPNDAVARHVDREDTAAEKINTASELHDPVIRRIIAVNESGLYALIFGSRLPAARAFKHWVTSVVLPTIRTSGGTFIDPDSHFARTLATDPTAALDMAATVVGIARELRERNQELADKNRQLADEHVVLAPKAAAYDAWFDTHDTCSVRDAARILHPKFGLHEHEIRQLIRDWRWIEKSSPAAATTYAVSRGYMVNKVYVTEFGPRPCSGRLTSKGLQRLEAKLHAMHPQAHSLHG